MKMSIAWHEQCLANRKASLVKDIERLERIVADVERAKKDIEVYSRQIEVAKGRGRDGFDSDRFMVGK
ncbi:MAG TPA: hypothetical protein DDY86_04000 [Syntrophaceae bacterium]|nr:hypothetical protein [Syntrophaceae bacterium]